MSPAGDESRATFRLRNAPYTASGELLGVWGVVEPASFGQPATRGDRPPIWQIDLPVAVAEAEEELGRARATVHADEETLLAAEQRLSAYVRSLQAPVRGQSLAPLPSRQPEVGLTALLDELGSPLPGASFGLSLPLGVNWQEAIERVQEFIDALTHDMMYAAWVQTRSAGTLEAWTAVSWLGDVDTLYRSGQSPQQAALHLQALALALASKQALLRKLIAVSRGAALLAQLPVLLATPGGALLALAAAWRFINQVSQESA